MGWEGRNQPHNDQNLGQKSEMTHGPCMQKNIVESGHDLTYQLQEALI